MGIIVQLSRGGTGVGRRQRRTENTGEGSIALSGAELGGWPVCIEVVPPPVAVRRLWRVAEDCNRSSMVADGEDWQTQHTSVANFCAINVPRMHTTECCVESALGPFLNRGTHDFGNV